MALTKLREWRPFKLYKSRQTDIKFTLYKEDEGAFALAAADVVRFKLWQTDGEVALDIDSVAATANNSVVTVDVLGTDDVTPAEVTVTLGAGDVGGLSKGEYKGELLYVDDSQTGDPAITVARGLVNVQGSAGGDVGLS